jgi:DNA (cytosine-5)-methyltransferase 1
MITTTDLFSGAGLMSEGFRQAGFKSIFAAEADKRAVASFNRNIEDVAKVWNVEKVAENIFSDVIVAGPPCQGFSTLGKRDSNDERNQLSLSVLKWMDVTNPKVVVIENVPQFIQSKYWKIIQEHASRTGYESCHWILNAVDFGAPQKRVRVFCVLSRIGIPEKPEPTHHNQHITVDSAFEGLPKKPNGKNLHTSPFPSNLALERIQLIPRNGDKRDVIQKAPHICPPSWLKMGNQAVDVWGRMNSKAPANTVRCSFQNASKGRYLHPTENRVITLREGARLQGVPDSWMFEGDRTSIARQIGNGVPIPLAKAVGLQIQKLFFKNSRAN